MNRAVRALILGLVLGLTPGLIGLGSAFAQSTDEIVALPDGERVAIGAQGPNLLAISDGGGLEAALWQLLDEGRPGDAVAVLAYVARHRPGDASALAVMGLRIVTDLQDTAGAAQMMAAILQESGADPVAVGAALREAGLPDDSITGVEVAALPTEAEGLPDDRERTIPDGDGVPPPPDDVGAGGERGRGVGLGDGGPGDGGLGDRGLGNNGAGVPADAPAYGYGGSVGGGGGFSGGLPGGLVIGGGGGGSSNRNNAPPINDPPADGGVS